MSDYKNWKPVFDFVFASLLLVLFLPLLMAISLLIKLEDPSGTVIFSQNRAGKKEKTFVLYKLRSMRTETEKNGQPLSDKERMLKVGKFVRKTSLDELPQLWNILKGDMSFIGPRPLLPEYVPYYTEEERKRHSIKPGISGWAQVNGRNRVTWEKKFKLDVEYVDQVSFWFDMKILFLTLKKVFVTSDIIEAGNETTQDFSEYRLSQQPIGRHSYKKKMHVEKRDLYG